MSNKLSGAADLSSKMRTDIFSNMKVMPRTWDVALVTRFSELMMSGTPESGNSPSFQSF